MLDPLIYGSVEFDAPPLATMTPPKRQEGIASLPPTTMPRAVAPLSSLPKTETDKIPSYVRPNLRELTADDIKDVQEHTMLLKTANAKKAEDAKQRRRVRSYKSTETSEDISTLSRLAAANGRAYICMFSPETQQTFAIRAWNELCKTLESETTTMLHGGEAPSVDDAIGIVNREGRILTVNHEWFNLIACSGTIGILKVLSELTDANILQDINSIKNGDRVLVYDTANIRCLRALTEWKCDEIHYVMPISNTGFSVACIVQKEDQTFIIHNV